ncbi:class I SAM-dependent methyltransferase [Celerinatantimonas sp. YJH-8]|uniref:class I SAM-dependent methyltransferase n=1 Tax=Celerinatantimonas sp. YJH-8 TaxID=3228714 RepID=UPI0038C9E613
MEQAINFDIEQFFHSSDFENIKKNVSLNIVDHTYKPKISDPKSDWVSSVAVPAFQYIFKEKGIQDNFASLGTGAGLDALAACQILHSKRLVVTDLHEDVVKLATSNIQNNLQNNAIEVIGKAGDLTYPLEDLGIKYDLIYENLPNIPLLNDINLLDSQNSSTFIADRIEKIPDSITKSLLSLHYLAVKNSQQLLNPEGDIISVIGGRIPLSEILTIPQLCHSHGEIILMTWKIQSEATDVINGYLEWEKNDYMKFHFYPVEKLQEVFTDQSYITGQDEAIKMETALKPYELSSEEALRLTNKGVPVGHTVVVLKCHY